MKQLLQNLKTGNTELIEVPTPQATPDHLLVKTVVSLISAGTERMLMDFGRASYLQKVQQVLDTWVCSVFHSFKIQLVHERKRTKIMGRIVQKAQLHNAGDLDAVQRGYIQPSQVHTADVEFIVDTGAAMLCLPSDLITALDLYEIHTRRVITANGEVTRRVYSPVRITINDREAHLDVMELPLDTLPLLGYLPLEALDLYPNPVKQSLEGNPKYNGKMVIDLLLYQDV